MTDGINAREKNEKWRRKVKYGEDARRRKKMEATMNVGREIEYRRRGKNWKSEKRRQEGGWIGKGG